jgi:hypothetical protein
LHRYQYNCVIYPHPKELQLFIKRLSVSGSQPIPLKQPDDQRRESADLEIIFGS